MLPQRLLGLLRAADPASGRHRLVRVARRVDEIVPEAFLAQAPGVARGFWESGPRWTAVAGSAASLEVTVGQAEPAGVNGSTHRRHRHLPPAEAADRFQAVREEAEGLLSSIQLVGDEREPSAPRLFGGFSFHDHHEPRAEWDRFPAAAFRLPALELDRTPQATTLTATLAVPRRCSRREARAHVQAALDRALHSLEQAPHPAVPAAARGLEANGRAPWRRAVERALHEIASGGLEKVVLARTLEVTVGPEADPLPVLAALRQANPGTHRFLLEPQPGSALIGAAPELVTWVRGRSFDAAAVAGSIARGATPDEDDRLARELLASGKDRAEHALVVDHVGRHLARVADHVEVAQEPQVLRLPRIQHLETPVRARLHAGTHALDVLDALHPTPAVCGTPRDAAKAFLRETEPFERGWYAGPVGWFDARGDGAFAPALRSAVLHAGTWHLYAGAGIVPGSDPGLEWEETGIKFRPVLEALEVEAP